MHARTAPRYLIPTLLGLWLLAGGVASASSLPDPVVANQYPLRMVGAGELRWLGFPIYDASLWTSSGGHTGFTAQQIDRHVRLMVITKGEIGASIKSDEREYVIPVVPAYRILDPTGVGDAFRGGFLRGYRLGLDLQTCGQMGALSATYCLEHSGPTNHTYSVQEYIRRYRDNFDDNGALDILIH